MLRSAVDDFAAAATATQASGAAGRVCISGRICRSPRQRARDDGARLSTPAFDQRGTNVAGEAAHRPSR